MSTETEILPCPFCGGPAGEVGFNFITCLNADLGERCAGKDIQVDADRRDLWNTRRAGAQGSSSPDREKVARAIHDGLGGNGWAYTNYSGDEWNDMRSSLLSAADEAIAAIRASPAADAGLAAPPAASADAVREWAKDVAERIVATARERDTTCELRFDHSEAVEMAVEDLCSALSTTPVAGADAGMRERAALKIEQGRAGLWYVTGLPGLLVVGDTKDAALSRVGHALIDMQTALPLSPDAGASSLVTTQSGGAT
jgi:hypothetical protein